MIRAEQVFQAASGRWIEILTHFGAEDRALDGKHHPCPACGGDDRFRYDDKNGKGDFYCNICSAGNGLQLVERMKRLSFPDAVNAVAEYLGIAEEQRMVLPVPASAPPVSFRHHELGEAIARWEYRNARGDLLGYVCRFDVPAPILKEIRTRTLWEKDGRRFWRWANFINPKPLYGLDRLAARPDAPVLVVEGEKTATAAARLMPEYVVISGYQGAKSPQTCDWSPVSRRSLVVWADNDEAGLSYSATVARCALAAGALSVRAIDLSSIAAARQPLEAPC